MTPMWAFFGHDEPNYTYMKDGRKLLSELAALSPVPVYVRAHNLLTTGDGTPALKWGSTNAYTEDAAGKPAYDWTIVDRIFDTYMRAQDEAARRRSASCRRRSRRKPEPVPAPLDAGRQLQPTSTPAGPIRRRTTTSGASWSTSGSRHCVAASTARREVESWYWEVWNEPDIGYWQGTPEEYQKLYDFAADGREAGAARRRGSAGPHVTGPNGARTQQILRDFLEHCLRGTNYATGKTGSPLDFVSFHAKGAPRFVDGHVRMGISNQLQAISNGFEIVASFPELREHADHHRRVRSGRLRRLLGARPIPRTPTATARCTRATRRRRSPGPTSWPTCTRSTCVGSVTWAFEFEDQPYFAGFRDLATNGIDKPVLNVFRMLGHDARRSPRRREHERRCRLEQIRDDGRARRARRLRARRTRATARSRCSSGTIMTTICRRPMPTCELTIEGLPAGRPTRHALSRRRRPQQCLRGVEEGMGSPQAPTKRNTTSSRRPAGCRSSARRHPTRIVDGRLSLEFPLPRQAVSLLTVKY